MTSNFVILLPHLPKCRDIKTPHAQQHEVYLVKRLALISFHAAEYNWDIGQELGKLLILHANGTFDKVKSIKFTSAILYATM